MEITLVTGRLHPSGEDIQLQQLPASLIPNGVFLLDSNDIQLLHEYLSLGTKLPSSEKAFQTRFPKKSIKKYLEYYDSGTYNVG